MKENDIVVFRLRKAKNKGLTSNIWCKEYILKILGMTDALLIFNDNEFIKNGFDPSKLGFEFGDGTCSNGIDLFRPATENEINIYNHFANHQTSTNN